MKGFSDNFFVKKSLYVTSAIAVVVLAVLIIFWNDMPVTQRLIGIFYVLIAAHEWEEMKYPGGFVEMVIALTGMPIKDMTIPRFLLFLITVYMLLIPFCIPSMHWLLIGPLVLGIIEPVAHIVVGRVNPKTRIYSPGLITSVLFMVPIDIYTIHYIVAVEPFAWYLWVIAALLLLIPLFGVQRFIVTNIMQMSYKEFVLNAKDSITGKRKIN